MMVKVNVKAEPSPPNFKGANNPEHEELEPGLTIGRINEGVFPLSVKETTHEQPRLEQKAPAHKENADSKHVIVVELPSWGSICINNIVQMQAKYPEHQRNRRQE